MGKFKILETVFKSFESGTLKEINDLKNKLHQKPYAIEVLLDEDEFYISCEFISLEFSHKELLDEKLINYKLESFEEDLKLKRDNLLRELSDDE
ncbi:MAG: hypothetical protein ACRC7W_01695 [Fusobacteriaceae bacterium]